MEFVPFLIFILVYLGMMLGGWPGLALDRTGIALLGAIAFIEFQGISISQAAGYVDLSALSILFSFMIISAQFYFSGFYTYIIERMEKWELDPSSLLLVIILTSAILSAVLINDIVCLALTPLIIKVCYSKKMNPIPFLVGLACSSNIGSALTLLGNPQNLLIGQVLNVPFLQYMKFSFLPCLVSLLFLWLILKYQINQKWSFEKEVKPEAISFDFWQSVKGIILLILLLIIFLATDLPRDKVSLVAAGLLLLSRKMASQTMLSFIDWQLLVLFIGLFIVNRGFLGTHNAEAFPKFLETFSVDLHSPFWLMTISVVLSNLISNVPAVMLLLPFIKTPEEGSLLALSSTFAGNLFLIGSIANLIVVSQASRYGIRISWKDYLRIGFPLTVLTFSMLVAWLYFFKAS